MHDPRFRALLILGGALLGGAVSACSSDDGRPSGGLGEATNVTADDGGSEAGATTTSDAGGGAGAGAKKRNADGPCSDGSECESGICFVGGNQSYCALKCTADTGPTICVAPFTGSCNKQGYCKRD